jgi:pimeloyl-ACP methyl ester carboxylesterase
MSTELVGIGSDRVLEVLRGGSPSGPVVIAHHGTPSLATFWADWSDDLAAAGLGLVAYSRPGYGGSTRVPDRCVADAAADSRALLDALGIEHCVALGYSGGGPHALALGARLADRCRGVVVVAGVAPFDSPGLDFMAGMGQENVAEFSAAVAGEDQIHDWMRNEGEPVLMASGAELAAALGDLLDDSDREVLAAGWADDLAEEWHRVAAAGTDGWADDDLAFTRPWGFTPAEVALPVTIWHAGLDRMAPVSHSRWLAGAIPGAVYNEVAGLGHLALLRLHRDRIIGSLVEQAR